MLEIKGVIFVIKIYNTKIETDEFEEIKEFKKGSWINLVKKFAKT